MLTALVLAALVLPSAAPAQRAEDGRVAARRAAGSDIGRGRVPAQQVELAAPETLEVRHAAWWMPLASAAVPGAGQALMKQDRFVVYSTVEGVAWIRYLVERREGSRQRSAYHDLANRVARAFYSSSFPTGNFEYYERMQHFVESGVFDTDPTTPTIEPESDVLSFNGSLWLLARQTFWEHPDSVPPRDSDAYARAEEFYLERAIRPEFRWSWRNAQLEHDLFRRTIAESNEAYRGAIQALGVVLANHVLSTVDAYVTLRLWTREAAQERSVGVAGSIPWAPFGRHASQPRRP